jgi:hypothetical protein
LELQQYDAFAGTINDEIDRRITTNQARAYRDNGGISLKYSNALNTS